MRNIKLRSFFRDRQTGFWSILVGVFLLLFTSTSSAQAQITSLTDNQRRAYLEYYAPIIMKRGNGNSNEEGRDWITNFDYDRDGNFSNNGVNYRNEISKYIQNARYNSNIPRYESWRIRPTLYTFLIEYQVGTRKDLVLMYHVYNATTEDYSQDKKLHDWERVEIRIKGATGNPGRSSEIVDFVTITNHQRSMIRRGYETDLHFMSTSTGKHAMIWQAEWSGRGTAAHGNELRFVQDSYSEIASRNAQNKKAEVEVNSKDHDKNVHYVYVPKSSSSAVSAWGAKEITSSNAHTLYSPYDNGDTVGWRYTKRIQYELQDIADISSGHWDNNNWETNWKSTNPVYIKMVTPMRLTQGIHRVPSNGIQRFNIRTKDLIDEDERNGYLNKRWFWGVHGIFRDSRNLSFWETTAAGLRERAVNGTLRDLNGRTRHQANEDTSSINTRHWYQHDYFAQTGERSSKYAQLFAEKGHWLVGDWHKASKGGFDGRWVQLFDDNIEASSSGGSSNPVDTNLSVSFLTPRIGCSGITTGSLTVSGSTPSYTVTWKRGTTVIDTDITNRASTAAIYSPSSHSVTVKSSTGKTWSRSFVPSYSCAGSLF